MPGATIERYELHELAVAANQQMRRDFNATNLIEIGMTVPVQRFREQLLDFRTAEFAGRQADAVQNQQLGRSAFRPLVLIGAVTLPCWLDKSGLGIDAVRNSHQQLPQLSGKTIVRFADDNRQRP